MIPASVFVFLFVTLIANGEEEAPRIAFVLIKENGAMISGGQSRLADIITEKGHEITHAEGVRDELFQKLWRNATHGYKSLENELKNTSDEDAMALLAEYIWDYLELAFGLIDWELTIYSRNKVVARALKKFLENSQ